MRVSLLYDGGKRGAERASRGPFSDSGLEAIGGAGRARRA
jgi:hypothetical protein